MNEMSMMKALENIQSTLDKLCAYQHDKEPMEDEESMEDTGMEEMLDEEPMEEEEESDKPNYNIQDKKKKPALKISILSKPVGTKRAFG